MKKIFVFLLFLLVFGTLSARSKFNETTIKGELRKPGVKLVAIDFYMTGCPPCDAAIPVWKKLKKEYGDALKLIVVAPQRDDGSCNVKDWRPDGTVCDEDMEIAGEWGVKDFPQAFLYSWHNNDPLVKLGHVNDVEKAIKEYFKHIPRVAIDADKSSKNLVPIIEKELIRNSKIELVSDESDRQSLLAAKKKSHQLNYDESFRCELGKEIAANSILKVTKQGNNLVLKLSSVEKSCTMATAPKILSGDRKKLEMEIASVVYDLLSQMFGEISTPENEEKSVPTQSFSSQSNGSTRDANACKYAREENSLEAWQDYLDAFSDGECSFEAKGRIRKLKKEREDEDRLKKEKEEQERLRREAERKMEYDARQKQEQMNYDEKPRLDVLEFDDSSGEISKQTLSDATEYIRVAIASGNKHIVIARERQRTTVSPDMILRTTIRRSDKIFLINSKLIDLGEKKVLVSVTSQYDATKDSLRECLDYIAKSIIKNGYRPK